MRLQSKLKNNALRLTMVALISSVTAILLHWIYSYNIINNCIGLITQFKNIELPATFITYLIPLIIAIFIIQITVTISPQQKNWSRIIIIFTSLFFLIRYFIWRFHLTLNLDDNLSRGLGIGLFLLEIIIIASPLWQTILTLKIKNRKTQAEELSIPVKKGIYQPSVDIFIPSYNEPLEVVKRTIVGCQAIEYAPKTIYLLDDGNRQEIKQICQELKCEYITRNNNLYAKAGNLNNALQQTNGELIVVFDADFVPTSNFLTRTVGFFYNTKIGLLQTYQSFYSPDPVAKNLGLEEKIPTDVEIFSRYYQVVRDSIHTALCYGSSFLVRRNYVEKIGGFITGTLSEDYHTGIRLANEGYEVVYLDESLSAGLSAENIFGYIRQRKRWARGTIQTLFIQENPLFLQGLNIWQKIAHLEGIFQWFLSPIRLLFLCLPLVYTLLDVTPFKASFQEMVYYFIPFYLVQIMTISWLNFRSRSALISDLYSVITAVPISLEIFQTLISPFSSGFKVTPKGIKSDKYYFYWGLASPLIFFFIINLFNLIKLLIDVTEEINFNFYQIFDIDISIILFWNIYNLLIILLSIIVLIEAPKQDIYQWLKVNKPVRVKIGDKSYLGMINKMSEIGAEIMLDTPIIDCKKGELELINEGVKLMWDKGYYQINNKILTVMFSPLSLSEYRAIIETLFCEPNTWKQKITPKELKSLWLLFEALLITPFNLLTVRKK